MKKKVLAVVAAAAALALVGIAVPGGAGAEKDQAASRLSSDPRLHVHGSARHGSELSEIVRL